MKIDENKKRTNKKSNKNRFPFQQEGFFPVPF